MQRNNMQTDGTSLLARMDSTGAGEGREQSVPPVDETVPMHDIYVLIVREHDEDAPGQPLEAGSVEAARAPTRTPALPVIAVCFFALLLPLASIALQVSLALHPFSATITIVPKSQQVTLSGTVQLGRLVPQITISQSQTTRTTGTGHQDAKQAYGYITFYNGQFQSVTIAAGTIFTGASGVQIVTDSDVMIPAGNPPSYGQTTIAAHAINAGSKGNIPAYDINQACCAASVLAKNIYPFTGGQDARTYAIVTHNDIHSISTVLKTSLAASMQGALRGQLSPQEQLQLLPCNPTVTSNHQAGEEAMTVKVTVSQTCSAVTYNREELQTKATTFLATQARKKSGAGYSLFGMVRVHVTNATTTHTAPPLVFLSFQAQGIWVYALSPQSQEQIKRLIAGKTTDQAVKILAVLPGVEHVAIRFSGIGDAARMPKNLQNIHLSLFVAYLIAQGR
jgi:VCBS repeat-containing protein